MHIDPRTPAPDWTDRIAATRERVWISRTREVWCVMSDGDSSVLTMAATKRFWIGDSVSQLNKTAEEKS